MMLLLLFHPDADLLLTPKRNKKILNPMRPLVSKWEQMSRWLSHWLPLMNKIWDSATLKETEPFPFGNEQLIAAACPSPLLWLCVLWLIDRPNVFLAPLSLESFQEAEDTAEQLSSLLVPLRSQPPASKHTLV